MGQLPVQMAGTVALDVPMDDVYPRPANARQAIDADSNPADFAGTQLVVVGRGDALITSPVSFDRAG